MKNFNLVISSWIVVSLIFVIFSPSLAYAENALLPSTQIDIENQQAKRLKKIEETKRELKQLELSSELPSLNIDNEEKCFNIEQIEFEGNTIFTSDEFRKAIDFESSCVGLTRINNFLRIITNKYVKAGYVTSRAFLVPQDLSSGILKIVIMEGRLEKLLFNGQPQSFLQRICNSSGGKLGRIIFTRKKR